MFPFASQEESHSLGLSQIFATNVTQTHNKLATSGRVGQPDNSEDIGKQFILPLRCEISSQFDEITMAYMCYDNHGHDLLRHVDTIY